MQDLSIPASVPEVAVIGAGPAGLMAAEAMARAGLAVTVYDRMPAPGRKLLMAGRGGLNLTHSEPESDFRARYGPESQALAAALDAFPPAALRDWADGLGADTFVGSSGRVFPRALKASPLLRAWLSRLASLGVRLATGHRWTGWTGDGALAFGTPAGPVEARPAATVLALGGASWPRLGSDGAWVDILRAASVEVMPLRPANMGFRVDWTPHFAGRFAGAPLKRIALGHGPARMRGEAVITASGIEGGAVYALSRVLREEVSAAGHAVMTVDLRPDLDAADLVRRLSRPRGAQSLSTFLRKVAGLPPVAVALLREGGAPPTDAAALARAIKAVPVRVTGPAPLERAISTAGGIAWSELDPGFMLTRRPGVFAAGEMLDWEAPTGGYLLQACFATGAAAARGVVARLARPAPGA